MVALSYSTMKPHHLDQARLLAPFGVLGIRCTTDALCGIDFLGHDILPQVPASPFAQTVCEQLNAYFNDPNYKFNLQLNFVGTDHQRKVWKAMNDIPCGKTRQYGELAKEAASSARAVGQACGANPVPIVIPCHRVVSKAGLGGFANHSTGYTLDIKRWLLNHEQR